VERDGARGSDEQNAGGHSGIERDGESRVEKLVSETGADEIVVVTDAYEHEDRLRSYERVAKEIAVAAQVRGSQLYVRSLGADRVVDYKTEDV
jgi:hypothetical protein